MKTISVTAKFTVTFPYQVTDEQFRSLDNGELRLDDVVDESVPYRLASSEGDCELDWDYSTRRRGRRRLAVGGAR